METDGLVASMRPKMERALMAALALAPDAPACAGILMPDEDQGGPTAANAITLEAYRAVSEPPQGTPEHSLWEAVGEALRRPIRGGREHMVLARHRMDGEKSVVKVEFVELETAVRAVVQEVLGAPRTPDERIADYVSRRALPHHPLEVLQQHEATIKNCVGHVDDQIRAFATTMSDLEGALRRQGVSPSDMSSMGKEMDRWWRDESRRPKSVLQHRAVLVTLLRCGLVEDARWLVRFSKLKREVVLPAPTSPRNTEVLAMAAAVLFGMLYSDTAQLSGDTAIERAKDRVWLARHLLSDRAIPWFTQCGLMGKEEGDDAPWGFLDSWRASAFARLEVSHKLAAALCLTDIPNSEPVHAPWEAWSLLVPDGLLSPEQPARIWCVGPLPSYVVLPCGKIVLWSENAVGGKVAAEMLRALVRGACLALSDPELKKSEGKWGGGATSTRAMRPHGPPLEGARYVLAQPVTIDLRSVVIEALSGKRRGGSPKAQFLVRGHFTHQPYGPQHSLRRVQWIEPYWKGDPEARILLRGHQVKDD